MCLVVVLSSAVFAARVSPPSLERALSSVVAIYPAREDSETTGGSGVIISPEGDVVTNFHVVQPCGMTMKCGLADGRLVDAVVVGLDPVGDLALLRLLPVGDDVSAFPFAELENSATLCVGDDVWAIGNPFLLACDNVPSISRGIVSGLHRYQPPSDSFLEYTDCIQTDAAINPGNSGGGLFDRAGRLVGISGRCSFEKRGRVNVGIGYAISSEQVTRFVGELSSGRIVDHATLGGLAGRDHLGRVVFTDISSTSDLALQGVLVCDEIVSVAGRAIDSPNTLQQVVGTFPPTWRVTLVIGRGEGTQRILHTLRVRLAPLHNEADLVAKTEKLFAPAIAPPEVPPPPRERPRRTEPQREKKHSFANAVIQKQELNRVLTAWRKELQNKLAEDNCWRLSGEILGEEAERGEFSVVVDANSQSRGGLIAMLTLLYRLARSTALDIGEVTFLGRIPVIDNSAQWCDWISVVSDTGTARCAFDCGTLAYLEFWSEPLKLPLELYVERDILRVVHGETTLLTVQTVGMPAANNLPQVTVTESDKSSDNNAAISQALERVVKVYGSGGLTGFHGYQSGCVVSPRGDVLTVWSAALEADPVVVVTASGKRYAASVERVDWESSLTLLKLDDATTQEFTHWNLDACNKYEPCFGDSVFGVSNTFNIAAGSEAASVQYGIVAAKARLAMRRGAFQSPYQGTVLVVDMTTNNLGAAGGALVDAASGELLGILGQELRDAQTHTWLNYAIPVREATAALARAVPTSQPQVVLDPQREPLATDAEIIWQRWGVAMVLEVAPRTPPFIDAVRHGSAAAMAGLRSDDLIVGVGGVLTPSLAALRREVLRLVPTEPIRLIIERDGRLLEVPLTVATPPWQK